MSDERHFPSLGKEFFMWVATFFGRRYVVMRDGSRDVTGVCRVRKAMISPSSVEFPGLNRRHKRGASKLDELACLNLGDFLLLKEDGSCAKLRRDGRSGFTERKWEPFSPLGRAGSCELFERFMAHYMASAAEGK